MTSTTEKHLSTTALARRMGKESKELFVLLTSGGWMVKVDDHWRLTEKGKFEGGIYVNHPRYGEYIAWPEAIHQHPLFALLPEAPLTASTIGHKTRLPARLVNLLLAERGWLKKQLRGWSLTPAGKQLGGQQHEAESSGVPYVTWPETLLENSRFLPAVAQLTANEQLADASTLDGRQVAAPMERMLANWLYVADICFAKNYPLEEGDKALTADFFVPAVQLCIDYWPAASHAGDLARQLEKQSFYKTHKMHFVEIHEQDVAQIDEVLARALFRAGLAVY
jgi:hypothetical protein